MDGSGDGKSVATTEAAGGAAARQGIPAGVWILGFVSMLMDISSEMIHALLPLYMVTVLGTSTLAVGIIEGIAEATASITKVFSGALSDWLGKRKVLAARLWPGGLYQADLSIGAFDRMARCRALHRPGRQGHSRRPTRCPRRRHCATASARRKLRPAPIAGHDRRFSWTASRHRPDVADGG